MSKILYIVDNDKKNSYKYNIKEDTIIYHFSIDSSSDVEIELSVPDVQLYYYYNNINYKDNYFNIRILHSASNTHSEVFNHGVNILDNKLNKKNKTFEFYISYFTNFYILNKKYYKICIKNNIGVYKIFTDLDYKTVYNEYKKLKVCVLNL